PAEIVDARNAAMVDDEPEVWEVGGDLVDVAHVEGVAVQGVDGRTLVDVDNVDAELPAFFEVARDVLLLHRVALRLALPFGGVELDAAEAPLRVVGFEPVEAGLAVARVDAAG